MKDPQNVQYEKIKNGWVGHHFGIAFSANFKMSYSVSHFKPIS